MINKHLNFLMFMSVVVSSSINANPSEQEFDLAALEEAAYMEEKNNTGSSNSKKALKALALIAGTTVVAFAGHKAYGKYKASRQPAELSMGDAAPAATLTEETRFRLNLMARIRALLARFRRTNAATTSNEVPAPAAEVPAPAAEVPAPALTDAKKEAMLDLDTPVAGETLVAGEVTAPVVTEATTLKKGQGFFKKAAVTSVSALTLLASYAMIYMQRAQELGVLHFQRVETPNFINLFGANQTR